MKLPNADRAVIAEPKLRVYLLDPDHRKGGSKAKKLLAMGYRADNSERLANDLRQQHLTQDVAESLDTKYGMQYVIVAPLQGPNGPPSGFRSVWQIDLGTDFPRLITMYPG